jgi:L-idonate 5-dehydrogenase
MRRRPVLSVVVHGAGDLRVEERPLPRPGPGQVLVESTHGGICGSDLHYYLDGAVGAFALREPLTLGHEVVGTVAEDHGEGPSPRLAPGTPVAIHPGIACERCPECRGGHPHVCRHSRYLGSAAHTPHTQGGFASFLAIRRDRLRPLPAGLPASRAVLAEPLGVALHALSRTGGVRGANVLVSGAGPIGALTAGAAKAAGAARVWACDLLDPPLARARAAGADETLRVGARDLPEEHFDVVIEASGAPAALGGVLAAVKRRGVVVQLGSLPGGPVAATLASIVAKEIELRGSFRFRTEIDDAVAMLATSERLEAVITHTFPLEEAAEAMEVAADPAVSGKVVLRLDNGRDQPGLPRHREHAPGSAPNAQAQAHAQAQARRDTESTRP